MKERLFILSQYLLPHHLLSRLAGCIAECRVRWFKNAFTAWFAKRYQVDMSQALVEDVTAYEHFNAFFTRALKDGARPLDVFARIILPMLWPVTVTNIVVQSVGIFNDFTNPLYFLPGNQNATVQLTLYNFQSQFSTSYNLLFTNILLITIPPLLVFLFFNRQIVAGMTAGAVKG